MVFKTLIEEKAEEAGYTVHGLFRKAGVAYSNWGRWCRGETSPNIKTFERLMSVEPKINAGTEKLSK